MIVSAINCFPLNMPTKITQNYNWLNFFLLPANLERRNIWISVLGLDVNLKLPKCPEICSNHFETTDYFYKNDGKKYLKPDAIPKGVEVPLSSR